MITEVEQRNIDTVRAYLAAVDSFIPDAVAPHLLPDFVQTNLPNVRKIATEKTHYIFDLPAA
jgi:hypothetical protein